MGGAILGSGGFEPVRQTGLTENMTTVGKSVEGVSKDDMRIRKGLGITRTYT